MSIFVLCHSLLSLLLIIYNLHNPIFTLLVNVIYFLFQFLTILTAITAVFDLYCLGMAAPGSTHYGYYIISYEFVYVGSTHGM